MHNDQVRVRARIHLLTKEQGGRATPLQGGGSYRPNHNFFGPESKDMCVGLIDLPEGQVVNPGDTLDVDMTLQVWPELAEKIVAGREWRIQEGPKLVGLGTVLERLDAANA
jgi:translation elongation factor EF-Tu-like GTPase